MWTATEPSSLVLHGGQFYPRFNITVVRIGTYDIATLNILTDRVITPSVFVSGQAGDSLCVEVSYNFDPSWPGIDE